ncbi:MAG: hypothetical protein KDD40_03710 [Bdellovibrionales bacterium]|nr:hypothetical protein [Bdellovibrionales bacterium]
MKKLIYILVCLHALSAVASDSETVLNTETRIECETRVNNDIKNKIYHGYKVSNIEYMQRHFQCVNIFTHYQFMIGQQLSTFGIDSLVENNISKSDCANIGELVSQTDKISEFAQILFSAYRISASEFSAAKNLNWSVRDLLYHCNINTYKKDGNIDLNTIKNNISKNMDQLKAFVNQK